MHARMQTCRLAVDYTKGGAHARPNHYQFHWGNESVQGCGSGRLQTSSGRHGLQAVTSQPAYCSTIVVASSPYCRAWAWSGLGSFPVSFNSCSINHAEAAFCTREQIRTKVIFQLVTTMSMCAPLSWYSKRYQCHSAPSASYNHCSMKSDSLVKNQSAIWGWSITACTRIDLLGEWWSASSDYASQASNCQQSWLSKRTLVVLYREKELIRNSWCCWNQYCDDPCILAA